MLCALTAQNNNNNNLPDENVNIFKDFNARLLESNKIPVTPNLPPLDTTTKRLDYIVPPKQAVVNYETPTLRPVGMRTAGREDVYNGFLKAGGGIPGSLYGEAGYYLRPSDQFDARLWLRHHSANADRVLENQRFFNNDIAASSNIFINDKIAVEAQGAYSFDRVHFYGYDHDSLSFDAESIRQDYKILDLGARLFNVERNEADLNYFVTPKFYVFNDFFSNRETGFNLHFGATKWFNEKHPLTIAIRTDFTRFEDTAVQRLNNIYLQPSFAFHSDAFKAKIGGNFTSNRDIFYVFPDVELNLSIFGDGFQLFAGAGGDLRKNTYRTISEYNPFIQIRGVELQNTQFRDYFGGIKGNLGWLEYTGRVAYSQATDLALFQTLFANTGITRFTVLYDTVNIFNLRGSFKLKPVDGLTVGGTLSSSVFDPNNEEKAWGLPNIEGNVFGQYALLDGKAQLKANMYFADQINYLDTNDLPQKTNALLDLSLGGSYYFTKNIGAFLDINNLLNNRRERWHDYPMFGLNILGGITARF
jgi:hypothetical protein